MAPLVYLGNDAAIERFRPNPDVDEFETRDVPGNQITSVSIPPNVGPVEALATITGGNGVWEWHSKDAPAWICCPDNPALAQLLASHYGCDVVDQVPAGWGDVDLRAPDDAPTHIGPDGTPRSPEDPDAISLEAAAGHEGDLAALAPDHAAPARRPRKRRS